MKEITGRTYSPHRNKRDNIYNIGSGTYNAVKISKELYEKADLYLNRKYENFFKIMNWRK